jgi:crotonobetainyl-CoA:carnitine CoA-transferase CaiB-like acyl-CoA transferase
LTHPTIAPYGEYKAGDGKSVIFGLQNDREWAAFCKAVLQQPALIDDPRFATNKARVQNRTDLDAVLAQSFAPLSRDDLIARLDAGDIANAPLNNAHDLWEHPQLKARNRWREVETEVGPIQALLPPAKLSSTEAAMGAVPALGEHTTQILVELGMAADCLAG